MVTDPSRRDAATDDRRHAEAKSADAAGGATPRERNRVDDAGDAGDAEDAEDLSLLDDDGLLDLRGRARATDPAAVAAEERARRGRVPATNRDLEAWRPEAPDTTTGPPADAAEGTVCHIDGDRAARYTCKQCGRPMCAEHTWIMFGLCTACATEERMQRWHDAARPEDRNWLTESQ